MNNNKDAPEVFTLDNLNWDWFLEVLDDDTQFNPKLTKLLSEPTVFDQKE